MAVPAIDLIRNIHNPNGSIASNIDVDSSAFLALPVSTSATMVDLLGSIDAPIFMLVRSDFHASSVMLGPVQRHVVPFRFSDTHVLGLKARGARET
jgi:hypothetical protein